jgi:bifunctional non-homologous end joining protein LigD
MSLRDYASRRQFGKTPEPGPGSRPGEHRRFFVVHKHAARRLHYDLRLALDGVLKSWAVPKGPSLDPSVKRLAVQVEDHPLAYGDFEGVIPEDQYGAGSVIVWDRGRYRHPSARDEDEGERLLLEGIDRGNLKIVLEGEKLRGEFALVRTGRGATSWLLLKKRDRYAVGDDILKDNRSVLSGKTLEEILEGKGSTTFRRKKAGQIRLREALESADLEKAPAGPMPHGIRPMLANLVREPFDDPDWLFEVKWDGYRAVAEIREEGVLLYSRNMLSLEKRYPPVVNALRTLSFEAVLDGEIVVVDDAGRPDFQKLQHYRNSRGGHLLYCVFDLLWLEGRDLTGLPLVRRKELLKKILPSAAHLRFSDHVWKEGTLFFEAARKRGLEGIVAKHSRSAYEVGKRSRQWLKVKILLTQEAVIAGFTAPGGSRRGFGALVLGAYEGDELKYIGHAGTGFAAGDLKDIREKLDPLVRQDCPFSAEPATRLPVTWVRPELVCEVALSGWTEDGVMRHPVFRGLREDKTAREAVLEKAARPQKEGA